MKIINLTKKLIDIRTYVRKKGKQKEIKKDNWLFPINNKDGQEDHMKEIKRKLKIVLVDSLLHLVIQNII